VRFLDLSRSRPASPSGRYRSDSKYRANPIIPRQINGLLMTTESPIRNL